jgi:hypothetical protein
MYVPIERPGVEPIRVPTARPKEDTMTMFRSRARLLGLVLGLILPTAALAGPYEVQMTGHLNGAEHAVDSYEVKCTQSASYLCVTLELDPAGEFAMQMTAVAVAPNNVVGQAFLRRVGSWDRTQTTCIARPGGPANIRAFVTVGGSTYIPAGEITDYTIKAECAVGGFGADPFAAKKTSIAKKQDQ